MSRIRENNALKTYSKCIKKLAVMLQIVVLKHDNVTKQWRKIVKI